MGAVTQEGQTFHRVTGLLKSSIRAAEVKQFVEQFSPEQPPQNMQLFFSL